MAKKKKTFLSMYQRDKFATGLIDWGNLVFVGLVIAQFVPGTNSFSQSIFIVGVSIYVAAYFIAYYLTRGGAFDD